MGLTISGREMLRTGYAEKREQAPRVALLDNFENCQNTTAHGEMTESVLLGQGLKDEDIQRFHCGSGNPVSVEQVVEAPANKLGGLLRAHVTAGAALLLKATSENLRTVLNEHPEIQVISQSQSQSPIRISQPFFEAARQDEDFRARLGQALGLPPKSEFREVADELYVVAERFMREEEAVQQAKQEYLQLQRQLHERGVMHLLPAGNLGQFATQLETAGHQLSPSGFRSLLASDFTTVVGSLDALGQAADFNSPRAGTEVLAPGVDIPFQDPDGGEVQLGQGTSLSVPLVAAQAADLRQQHPEWTPFQMETTLQGVEAYQLAEGSEQSLTLEGQTKVWKSDGRVDDFVLEKIGSGFISGLNDESVPQFIESDKSFRLVLPGETQDVFQVIDVRPNGEGQRKFELQTQLGPHIHVIHGEFAGGKWLPERAWEEFYPGSR